jgi:hypothetical protein
MWRWCALSMYVILSNIWRNLTNVTAAMCPQDVHDLVEYLKRTQLMSWWWCLLRLYVIPSIIWKGLANATVVMCRQVVRGPVKYFQELGWCHGGDVPSGGTWSCQIFERTWLKSWQQCALRMYVMPLGTWQNLANVTAVMYPQDVRDPVEYSKNLVNITMVTCPQIVCDTVEYLKELV